MLRPPPSHRSERLRRIATATALLAAVVAVDALAGGSPRPLALLPRAVANRDSSPALASLLRRDAPAGARAAHAPSTSAPLDAYLVTSPRDCASNLGALDLLAREGISSRIHLAAALVATPSRQQGVGQRRSPDSADIATVRDAIAARDLPVPPVRPLDQLTARLLRQMGYRDTPFLVVLDSAGTLRFAAPSARTDAEFQDLARALHALAAASSRAR